MKNILVFAMFWVVISTYSIRAQSETAAGSGTQLITTQTPWRVWMVTGAKFCAGTNGQTTVYRPAGAWKPWAPVPLTSENAEITERPEESWAGRDYDDSLWGRYGEDLSEYAGGYGAAHWDGGTRNPGGHPALLFLRSRFGIQDPAQATDVQVEVEYLGGAVVFVNGIEVGRNHLAAGKLEPLTQATAYPLESYVTEDGTTPLPVQLAESRTPDPRFVARCQNRVRTLKVTVPEKVLVKGANVLAVELHRAPVNGPLPQNWAWSHVGIRSVKLTSARGLGAIGYEQALAGPRVWSAQETDQITDRVAAKSLLHGGWGDVTTRGNCLKGISNGNPFDPVTPVRVFVPRNGIGNGQVVLSDPAGLRDVTAKVGLFTGPKGAVLPETAVRVRFAAQAADLHYCNDLRETPPAGAKTIPVWLEVHAAATQAPGWYGSTVSLMANGKTFTVPVQVFITGFTLPESKDLRSVVVAIHSPEALANAYKVDMWSDKHFALMAKSLEIAGQLGNDVLIVPVIMGTHMGFGNGLIRWIKTDKGLVPDFRLFEKYLDLYLKYCAPPKAIDLYVWSPEIAKEVADVYENRKIPTREAKPNRPLQVTQWDPQTGKTTVIDAPWFLDDGAEAFWKPMLDGVRAIVTKRGWSERKILLGCGSDLRPSTKTGEAFRKWAPYARWNIYSHFSGDIWPKFPRKGDGAEPVKFMAIGNLEVGLLENPTGGVCGATQLETLWMENLDFLRSSIHRLVWDGRSGPMPFRTVPFHNGRLSRLGIDFWPGVSQYGPPIWGGYPCRLTWQAPEGPATTVQLQLIREGFQDFEARLVILEGLLKLPAEGQKTYRALLDDYGRRNRIGETILSQAELSLDFPSYVARIYRAAEEMTGVNTEARWEEAPK